MTQDALARLLELVEKATPPEDWLDALFADQWTPRVEEFLRACSPEVVAALVRVAQIAAPNLEWNLYGRCPVCLGWNVIPAQGECSRVHTKTCEWDKALRALDAALAKEKA